jgi:hypothetical protein
LDGLYRWPNFVGFNHLESPNADPGSGCAFDLSPFLSRPQAIDSLAEISGIHALSIGLKPFCQRTDLYVFSLARGLLNHTIRRNQKEETQLGLLD